MSALENFLTSEPEADEEDWGEVESPADAEQADWQLRRLGRLRRLMAENEAIAHVEIQRIKRWLEQENLRLEQKAAWIEAALTSYHKHLLTQDAKRKTVSLPAGTLKARKHPDRVDLIDVETFVTWALNNRPDLVRIKPEPMKAEIKRLLSVGPSAGDYGLVLVDPTTGLEAPGVVLVEGETSFTAATPNLRTEAGE